MFLYRVFCSLNIRRTDRSCQGRVVCGEANPLSARTVPENVFAGKASGVFDERSHAMADVNKAAQIQAQVDHTHGQSAPNLANLPHSAREVYQREADYLKRMEEAKKNT